MSIQEFVSIASKKAILLQHKTVKIEHLLLAIIQIEDSEGKKFLNDLSVSIADLEIALMELFDKTIADEREVSIIITSKEVEDILKFAEIEAKIDKAPTTNTKHILKAILREDDLIAKQILNNFGVFYDSKIEVKNDKEKNPLSNKIIPNNERVALKPHHYPKSIRISFVILALIFVYTFTLIPKILNTRSDVKMSMQYIEKGDLLYFKGDFDEAIPYYKKGVLLSWRYKPIKLISCYLRKGDENSMYKALGILANISSISQAQYDELAPNITNKYFDCLRGTNMTFRGEVIQTTYHFDLSKCMERNSEEYKNIKKAEKEYKLFLETNPNR